jgi:mannosyltransferase OCH1-like enzyme
MYDNNDCRIFIASNFDSNVLDAYDSLIPGAYKADLWRYCILYKLGGIYLDIKYYTVNNFKLISLTDKEYFVRDIEKSGSGIYNAFMICKPGNPKMLRCIHKIIENVKNRFYGESIFSPTGPLLLLNEFDDNELAELDIFSISEFNDPPQTCITMYDKPILAIYKEYNIERKEFIQNQNTKPYYELWKDRQIYAPIL